MVGITIRKQLVRSYIDDYDINFFDLELNVELRKYNDSPTLDFHIALGEKLNSGNFDEDSYSESIHSSSLIANSSNDNVDIVHLKLSPTKVFVTINVKLPIHSKSFDTSNFLDILKQFPRYLIDADRDFDLAVYCIVNKGSENEVKLTKSFNVENPFIDAQFVEQPKAIFKSINFKLAIINRLKELGFYAQMRQEMAHLVSSDDQVQQMIKYYKELKISKAYLEEVESIFIHCDLAIYQELRTLANDESLDSQIKTLEDLIQLPNLREFYTSNALRVDDYSPLINYPRFLWTYDSTFSEEVINDVQNSGKLVQMPGIIRKLNQEMYWAYVEKGEAKFTQKRYEDAIDLFKTALKYRRNHQVTARIGSIYQLLNKRELKLHYFFEAIKIKPDYAFALNDIAYYYYTHDKLDLALRDINIAVNSGDEYDMAYATKAEILFKIGDEEEFFKALEESTCRGIDPKILDGGISKKYEHDHRYQRIIALPNLIRFERNNDKLSDKTILDLDHYYYAYLSKEKSPHRIDSDLSNYFDPVLVESVKSKIIPLLKIDISDLSPSAKGKIPVLYNENYQFDWTISCLNDRGLISEIYFYDGKMLHALGMDTLNKMTFFDDLMELSIDEVNSWKDYSFHIVKEPAAQKRLGSNLSISEASEWMIANELGLMKTNKLDNYLPNFGPVPFYLQHNFDIPSSPNGLGDYTYVGRIPAYDFGLIDVYYYLFYNEKENKVAQLMQCT